MPVYLPHTGRAPSDWTLAWAQWYSPEALLVPVGPANDAYARLFAGWWEAEPFVVVEQDVVPWPGADRELAGCPEPWCAMSYYPDDDGFEKPTLGCAKFIPSGPPPFEHPPPDIHAAFTDGGLPHWQALDMVVASTLRHRGLSVHQHYPAVAHIKPAGYGMATVGFMGKIGAA